MTPAAPPLDLPPATRRRPSWWPVTLVLAGLLAIPATEASAAPTSTAPPVVSGLVKGGQVVTASTGTWTTPGETSLTYTYQWQTSPTGAEGSWTNSTNLGNATATYLILLADATQYLRVCVTASDGDTATACTTGVVIENEPYPTRIFTQSGWSVLSDATSRVSYWNPNQDWNGFSSNGTTNYWSGWYTAPAVGGTGVSVPNSAWSRSALIDDQYLYRNNSDATIARSNIDGSDYRPNFVTGLNVRDRKILARGKNYLYYRAGTDGTMMGRAPITGGVSENDFMLAGMNENSGIAVGSDYIYWGRGSCIARADITGTGVENCWVNASFGRNSPIRGMGIDQNALYFFFWPYDGPGYNNDKGLVRVNLDGTGLMRLNGTSGDATPISVAQASRAAGPLPVNSGGADAPAISGTPLTGNTLAVSAGSWTNTPASYTYRWLVSNNGSTGWSVASGVTGTTSSYVIPGGYAGKYLQARVIAHNGSTWSEAAYTNAVLVPAPPVNTVVPAVTGTVQVGDALSANSGTWTYPPADASGYAYEWQVSDDGNAPWVAATGSGAATNSYTVALADDNKYLRVKVTATNDAASTSAYSTPTGAVNIPAPVNTGAPAISGTVGTGAVLTATAGTWNAFATDSPTYQWQVSDDGSGNWTSASGSGATTDAYTVADADAGKYLRVVVTAHNRQHTTDQASDATTVVIGQPANTELPAISGTAGVGQQLTATQGTWDNADTYAYQWQVSADGSTGWATATGSGADTASYTVADADADQYLRVVVTASGVGGDTDQASDATTVVIGQPDNTELPAISGTAGVGQQLTATQGTWANADTYAYAWQVSPDGSTGWATATGSGADTASYTVADADADQYLRVVVTASGVGGDTDQASDATTVVIGQPDNTELPAISGTAGVGQQLTATQGTWANADTYAYEWQVSADGSTGWATATGGGANTASYTVAAADAGKYLRVVVTASGVGGEVDQESAATSMVPVPVVPVVPTPTPPVVGEPQATPPPVVVAPGISVGETFNSVNLDTSTPAAARDLLKGAQVNLPASATITFVASSLPQGLRLVGGKLVADTPGTYVVRVKVTRKNGKIGTRRVKIVVG